MRRWVVAFWLIGLVSKACAGDLELPTLRGSNFTPTAPSFFNWSGFYAGGHVSYQTTSADFSAATSDLVAHSLRLLALEDEQHVSTWPVLGKATTGTSGFGGFGGFNTQWDEAILGLDVTYTRSNTSLVAPNFPLTRSVSAGGNAYVVTLSGAATLRLIDYATARVRAGYIMNNFLPYVTLGVAAARVDTTRSVTIPLTENGNPFSFSESDAKNASFVYGWAAGGGVDVAVLPNVFLRGEYEYVSFQAISGIGTTVQAVRLGGGIRF